MFVISLLSFLCFSSPFKTVGYIVIVVFISSGKPVKMYICKKKINLFNIFIFLAVIDINIRVIIYSLLNLYIQVCNYCFYILVSWFLLIHTCLTYDTIYVLSNYKWRLLLVLLLRRVRSILLHSVRDDRTEKIWMKICLREITTTFLVWLWPV